MSYLDLATNLGFLTPACAWLGFRSSRGPSHFRMIPDYLVESSLCGGWGTSPPLLLCLNLEPSHLTASVEGLCPSASPCELVSYWGRGQGLSLRKGNLYPGNHCRY